MNNGLAKQRAWTELVEGQTLPRKLRCRLDKLKRWAWHDAEFWADLLDRHGLKEKRLAELDPGMRDHVLWNFQAMLLQIAHEHGVKV